MSHVEVDHVLCVGALDRNGKGFERVEGEGNQATHSVINRPSQQARLDLKLQQAGVTCIKSGGSEMGDTEAALNSFSPVCSFLGRSVMKIQSTVLLFILFGEQAAKTMTD